VISLTRRRTCALALLSAIGAMLHAQDAPVPQPVAVAPNLSRLEGVDASTGISYVRLLLSLPKEAGEQKAPPRFTVECYEDKGKRNIRWLFSVGGVDDVAFVPPFRPSPGSLYPPIYPAVNLKMTFEGYIKWKPFTRSWSVLPSGELRYRNAGTDSPNMDSPAYFMHFLDSLPGIRLRYAKGNSTEIFFQTQPLLDEMKKSALCAP
jgi:hypothetical protein